MDIRQTIADRMAQRGLTVQDVARALGDAGPTANTLYRFLRGEQDLRCGHLERVLPIVGLALRPTRPSAGPQRE